MAVCPHTPAAMDEQLQDLKEYSEAEECVVETKRFFEHNFLGSPSMTENHLRFFEQVLRLGVDFKSQPSVKAFPYPTPTTKVFEDIPAEGISSQELLECYQNIAKGCSNWGSPSFVGFPDAGNAVPSIAASLLIPLLNQNLANQDICAPSATFIEMELVHWLRKLLGFPVPTHYSTVRGIGGVLTLGGCLSNTVALMAAREHTFPGSSLKGLPVMANQARVLVPEIIEHYSIRSAMAWLGLGEEQVVRVPVDSAFRMRLDKLDECIDGERAKGRHIIACIAYAGDSRSMCVDDLEAIAACLQRKNVWFHVDACHGSQLAFSRKHKHKINGISLADSITIDPHKVFWTPNTCSFVLFRNPCSLANISTNSDLILKTQWSLGQMTPCIGSKAFDALKLWSVVKSFGFLGIERLIDHRLELTSAIQQEVIAHKNLVLLNKTDINSCIFQYIPLESQSHKLSVADLEKVNDINRCIKTRITDEGQVYAHGFTLKSIRHPLFPLDRPVYVLIMLNGNPLTSIEHIRVLLRHVQTYGDEAIAKFGYMVLPSKLYRELSDFFGPSRHVALMYGSSSGAGNCLFSDIDMMAFADDDFCTPNRVSKLKKLFEHIMVEEGFLLDDEVPLERKLLVSLSVARSAAGTRCQIQDGKIKSVEKCRAFLNSDTMLERLIFNVLTVPTIQLSGDGGLLSPIQASAEDSLYDIINAVAKDPPFTAQDFISTALTDGTRVGEDYLGYKDRPEVTEHLEKIFERQMSSVASHTGGAAVQGKETNHAEPIAIEAAFPPCVVLLNGFPGVGKYCISRELETIIPRETRLIDNHILIDPVEAIHPGRTPQHYQLRKTIRNAAFDAIKNLQSRNVTVLMTSCLSSSDADIEAFSEHLDIARCRKVPFILVNVLCAAENNLTRLQSLERVRGQKSKLTDPTVLQEIREKAKLLDPVYSILDVQDVRFHYLEIDSTTKTAAEAADAVARFVTALTAHKAPNRAGQQDLSLFWRVVSVLSQLNQWLVRRL